MDNQQPSNASNDAPGPNPDWSIDTSMERTETSAAGDRSTTPGKHHSPTMPESIPGYTLHRKIYSGGQGVVYHAVQHATGRQVAIKIMKAGPFADETDRARFDREVHVLAQLQHPNIVAVIDSGRTFDHDYFVMDFIDGVSLDQWLAAQPRTMDDCLQLLLAVCDAVQAAHARGIIHRDLKPGNICVDSDDRPHVLDFGIAKLMEPESPGDSGSAMTLTGQFMGSLSWAAPEQAEGNPDRVSTATDVYALGLILYKMLTRQLPYGVEGSFRDVTERIMHAPPQRPRTIRRELARDLETIVLKCLDKDPQRRYATAGDLSRDIALYLAGRPIEAKPNSYAYVAQVRTTAFVRRHPLGSCVLAIVVAVLIGQFVGFAVLYQWTPIGRWYESAAFGHLPPPDDIAPLSEIRIIAIHDHTDVDVIGRHANVDATCLETDPKCWRAAHGALMKRLAIARPSVVAWNIAFCTESGHDAMFVAGTEALRDTGCEIIVASNRWELSESGLPPISAPLLKTARWGCTPMGRAARAPEWRTFLAVQRGLEDPLPSFALTMYAACREPGTRCDLRLDTDAEQLHLMYWEPSPNDPHVKIRRPGVDHLQLSAVRPATDIVGEAGIEAEDHVGYYMLRVPPAETLEAATLDYSEVFAMSDEQLRSGLAGKVIIIGDRRQTLVPDGAPWGTALHAAALDMLLRNAPIRLAPGKYLMAFVLLAAILGGVIGWRWFGGPIGRAGLITGTIVLLAIVTIAMARGLHVLYTPLMPAAAMALAAEATARIHHTIHVRQT